MRDKITLGLIPARGGSKGILKKNLVLIKNKPLICFAIECGLSVDEIDLLICSTDDDSIAKVAMTSCRMFILHQMKSRKTG